MVEWRAKRFSVLSGRIELVSELGKPQRYRLTKRHRSGLWTAYSYRRDRQSTTRASHRSPASHPLIKTFSQRQLIDWYGALACLSMKRHCLHSVASMQLLHNDRHVVLHGLL